MSFRPRTRGTSILAALVFVAILGTVALGVNALSPGNPASQTATAVGAIPGADGTGYQNVQTTSGFSSTGSSQNSPTTQKPDACLAARNEAAAQNAGIANAAKTYTSTKQDPDVFDPCVAAVLDTSKPNRNPSDPNSYKCVGKSAVVSMSDGQVVDKSTPNESVPSGQCKTMACEPSTNGKMNCFNATLSGGLRGSSLATTLNGGNEGINPFSISSNNPLFDQSGLPKDLNTTYAMDQAFAEQQTAAQGNLADVNKQISSVDDQLKQLAGSNCPALGECYSAQQQQDLEQQKADLLVKQQELQRQVDGLSKPDQQATLTDKSMGSNDPAAPTGKPDCSVLADSANNLNCYPSSPNTFKQPGAQPNPQPASQPGAHQPQLPPNLSSPTPRQSPGGGLFGGSGGGLSGGIQSMLGGLLKGLSQGLAQQAAQANAPACPSDPNAYAQAQQQYNMQLQQYNLQLQQYNMQSQYAQFNGMMPPPPPQAPVACQPNTATNTCAAQPPQPTNACEGTWRPIQTQQSNGASCTTGWQCVPSNTTATPPTAQISCEPLVADVGMSLAISFTCGNATGSAGLGFDTQNATSGATSTIIANPPQGVNTATFGVECRNQGLTANAQCSVQIGKPTIVLVSTPNRVPPQGRATIGWVTSGMRSCVISSPTLVDFTAQNATNTSVTGAATTPQLATTTDFLLHCATVGGNVKEATTTVIIAATSTTP